MSKVPSHLRHDAQIQTDAWEALGFSLHPPPIVSECLRMMGINTKSHFPFDAIVGFNIIKQWNRFGDITQRVVNGRVQVFGP